MYQLFKNIYFVKGFNRTLIFDALNNKIHFIPNEFYENLLTKEFVFYKKDIQKELFLFLKNNDLIFETSISLKGCFNDVQMDYEIPYNLMAVVIELTEINAKNLFKFNSNHANGKIPQFNIIFSVNSTLISLNYLSDFIKNNEADTFEITLIDGFNYTEELFFILEQYKKIIIINNFLKKSFNMNSKLTNRFINNTDFFSLKISLNLLTYYESIDFNTYFYRRLYIGKDSEIKNVKESQEIIGYLDNLLEFNIDKIISSDELKKYWGVKKNETLICKSCEFRRLCVDNRLPKRVDSYWTHENECEYNPFISKWKWEDGFLNLNDSGITFNENGFIINKHKLKKVLKNLWEE